MTGPQHYRAAEDLPKAAGNARSARQRPAPRRRPGARHPGPDSHHGAVVAVDVELEHGPVVPPPHEEWSDVIL